MKNATASFLIVASLLTILGCKKDTPKEPYKPYQYSAPYNVAPCFEKYIVELEKQGNLRGKNLDFKKNGISVQTISAKQMNEVAPGAWGIGSYTHGAPDIAILESLCTDDTTYSLSLEKLIFHEYGHSGLHRNHLCGVKGDGFAESIMYGTLGNPSTKACSYGITDDYVNQRSYYLDELFKSIPDSLLVFF